MPCRVRLGALALAAAVALSGCGSDATPSAATQGPVSAPQTTGSTTTVPPTAPPTTSAPSTSATPAPVAIVGIYEDIAFYPACGNETLDHLGVTWYPVVHAGFDPYDPDLQARADQIFAVDREESPVAGVSGFARVPAPGPGDDIGTLVVWADGVARFVSDSLALDVWMIDDELTYNWVC